MVKTNNIKEENNEQELKSQCFIARTKRKLSQSDFAKIIGSNQTEVSFIERGFIPKNKSKIKKIRQLYNNGGF